jgi:probable O-glycosylation ligase (exosortase A-associated)
VRDILVLTITILCTLIALRRPAFGLLSYVGFSVLIPQSYTWIIKETVPLSKVIGIGTIIGFIFSSEPKRFPRQRETVFLVALWLVFGVSTLFAIAPERAPDGLTLVSKTIFMAILTTAIINTDYRLHLLLKIIALGLGVYSLKVGIFVLQSGGTAAVFGPDNSYLEANNTLGMALAMNVPLLFYLSKLETKIWLRWIMRGMLVFSYPAVVGTFARGDWLGLAVITVLLVMKSKRKFLMLPMACIGVILAAAWVPQYVSKELVDRYDLLVNYEDDTSAQIRFWTWELCKRVGLAHPLSGGGFLFYSREAIAIYFPEFLDRWPGRVASCHNMWLAVFAEHGFIAFLLWVALMSSCLVSLRQIRAYGRTHTQLLWMADYADMLQAALVGFIVMGMFVDFMYYEIFYLLVAVIILLKERMHFKITETSSTDIDVDMYKPILKFQG